MTNPNLKIKAATAEEICKGFVPSEAALALLTPSLAPLPFLESLIQASLFADAMQFLTRALPKREAVWWACVCIRDLPPIPGQPTLAQGMQAAENWVYRPTDENRRLAEKAAEAIRTPHPARWAAMAAFWSGGSLAPIGAPEVEPADDFTAKAVGGAVMMAAGMDAAEAPVRNSSFMRYGIDIAKGGNGRPKS